MDYWLAHFTGMTWADFRKAGAKVAGFPEMTQVRARPGDILLCYLTGGVKLWVGALRVIGPSNNTTRIWKEAPFPVRLDVSPLLHLDAEHGVPMQQLEGRVSFYTGPKDAGTFKGFLLRSLRKFERPQDGE